MVVTTVTIRRHQAQDAAVQAQVQILRSAVCSGIRLVRGLCICNPSSQRRLPRATREMQPHPAAQVVPVAAADVAPLARAEQDVLARAVQARLRNALQQVFAT